MIFFLIVLFRTAAQAAPSFESSVKTLVIGMVLEDISKFLQTSTGVRFCLEFIEFEDHFEARCFRVYYRFLFLESRLCPKAKRF